MNIQPAICCTCVVQCIRKCFVFLNCPYLNVIVTEVIDVCEIDGAQCNNFPKTAPTKEK